MFDMYEQLYLKFQNKTVFMSEEDEEIHGRFLKRSMALCKRYNYELLEESERRDLLNELFHGAPDSLMITEPFFCDVGYNISWGEGDYLNYGCVILDIGEVKFGDHMSLGPGVKIAAVDHPRDPEERARHALIGKPITIGNNVWTGPTASSWGASR